jgi:hypothetical protein
MDRFFLRKATPTTKPSHGQNSRPAPVKPRVKQRRNSATTKNTSAVKSPQPRQPRQVKPQPPKYLAPLWLKLLLALQKISLVLFVSVFGLSSIVYGYTMHNHTTWRSQQDRLRRWQNQERQQAVMNENLKQQLAQAAEVKNSGLVSPKPEQIIFIHSAPLRQSKPLPNSTPSPQATPTSKLPLGY